MKYIIITITALSLGCQTAPREFDPQIIDEVVPSLDIENNLLFNCPNIAYKSITIKDIIGEKDFNDNG